VRLFVLGTIPRMLSQLDGQQWWSRRWIVFMCGVVLFTPTPYISTAMIISVLGGFLQSLRIEFS
jgi:hypothetical protein